MKSIEPFLTKRYAAKLEVVDRRGVDAWFTRRQTLEAQEDGVINFVDRPWGDGVILASYTARGMRIADAFQGRRGYIIILRFPKPLARGETIELETRRRIVGAFTDPESYWELAMPGRTEQFIFDLVAPSGLPIRFPHISAPSLRGIDAAEDKGHVRVKVANPEPYVSYKLDWSW